MRLKRKEHDMRREGCRRQCHILAELCIKQLYPIMSAVKQVQPNASRVEAPLRDYPSGVGALLVETMPELWCSMYTILLYIICALLQLPLMVIIKFSVLMKDRWTLTSHWTDWHLSYVDSLCSQNFIGIVWQGRPCHLYFDLEFNIRANPNATGEAMVDTLLSVMSDILLDVFSLHYEPSWTVELDSSTAGTHCLRRGSYLLFSSLEHLFSFLLTNGADEQVGSGGSSSFACILESITWWLLATFTRMLLHSDVLSGLGLTFSVPQISFYFPCFCRRCIFGVIYRCSGKRFCISHSSGLCDYRQPIEQWTSAKMPSCKVTQLMKLIGIPRKIFATFDHPYSRGCLQRQLARRSLCGGGKIQAIAISVRYHILWLSHWHLVELNPDHVSCFELLPLFESILPFLLFSTFLVSILSSTVISSPWVISFLRGHHLNTVFFWLPSIVV